MILTEANIISDIVAEDYRTAAVFQSLGIDFYNHGNRSIAEACDMRTLEPEILINDLKEAINNSCVANSYKWHLPAGDV